jgi:hypothetical protein
MAFKKSILYMLSITTFATIITADKDLKDERIWQKVNEYALTHKEEIIKNGLEVIAASLGTQMVRNINKKIVRALQSAKIRKGSEYYAETYSLLSTYGLFGADEGIKELVARQDAGQLARIATTLVGHALADFWGISHATLAGRITAKGIGSAIKEGVQAVQEAL